MRRRLEFLLALIVSLATIGGVIILQPDAAAQEPTVTSVTAAPVTTTTEPPVTTTTVPPRPANEAWWLLLGRCEQPGAGYGGVDWGAHGSTSDGYFEGGLGIMASLYRSIAGHSALEDPPEAQMEVGNVVLARYGAGAWGCTHLVGPP